MQLSLKLDCREWIERLEFAAVQAERAIGNAVARSARTSRRQALENYAKDANIAGSRAKRGQPLVRSYGLSASWSPATKAANLGSTGGVSWTRQGGLSARSYVLTGGGSSQLIGPHSFLLRANGGGVALERVQFGKGTHRGGTRKMFAESAATGMSQANGSPRATWQRTADEITPVEIAKSVQDVLDGYSEGDVGAD